jgi:hypothetical protein
MCAGLSAALAMAQTQGGAGEPAAGGAMHILKRMGDFLAAAQAMSATARVGNDVVQDSGQKIEFGHVIKCTIKRPDRFRLDGQESNGGKGFVLFDGKEIVGVKGGQKVYAAASKSGTLDDVIPYLLETLKLRIPPALLLVSDVSSDIVERVQSADVVETDVLMGEPCDHIAARTETVVLQLRIAQGNEPLPRRVVLTYKNERGQPQFWGHFTEWNMKPELAGVEKIRFRGEVEKKLAAESKAASKAKGKKGGKR